MDDRELAALLAAHESRAVGYYNSEIADEQARAIDYYYGRMDDLPALDGCSSVVDHSVAVMVDNALAAILKPFVSADEVVSFQPRGPEDQAQAEQATEYVNYVIACDNPGFTMLHSWFKDALLTKLGVVKTWWEDLSHTQVRAVAVDALGLETARASHHYLGEKDNGDGTFTVELQETVADGRVRIENVPPEEFLISPFARGIEEASYVAHRPGHYTRSDLVALGFDAEVIGALPAASGAGRGEESRRQARYRDEQWYSGTQSGIAADRSRDAIAVIDEYVRCDYDGDGVSELRRVIRVGDTILFNEPAEDVPFALLCPCPMPHKVYGRALADLAVEGQKVSTAVLRQTLDNLYKTNNPRPVVPDTALNESTMDDLGDSSPGAAIRVKAPAQLDWAIVPFSADKSFTMLEYIQQQTEERTGIQRKGNGLNPETLKKNSPDTATQAAIDENSRNERAEMIARIFAETGVKRLFTLVLALLKRHQPRARVIRLRNLWVPMDPSAWSAEMDVGISVGLGVGNKSEQIMQANEVLATMAQLQQTPYAWLVDARKVHAALKRKFVATGIRNVDDFLVDPATAHPPPPQPPAEAMKAQMEMQIEAMRLQARQQESAAKLQLEQAKAAAQAQVEQARAQAEAQSEAAKLEIQRARADFEARLALQESQQQYEIERIKLEMALDRAAQTATPEESAMRSERPGGRLDR